jgi:hypothetical protein
MFDMGFEPQVGQRACVCGGRGAVHVPWSGLCMRGCV